MVTRKSEVLITQSLVDRLSGTREWPGTRAASIRMYRESLKRDLEWLLNTRQPMIGEIDRYPQASASVIQYGLADVQSFTGSDGRDRNALSAALLRTIQTFEPRIKNPKIFLTRADTISRTLRFHIDGEIEFEDMEEEITFDTVLELVRGEFEVK